MSEWQPTTLAKVLKFSNGRSSPERDDCHTNPVYGSNGVIGYSNETNAPSQTIVIGRVGSYCGSLYFSTNESWITDNAIRANALDDNDPKFLFYLLQTLGLNHWRTGSGQPLLNQTILGSIPTSIPEPNLQRIIAHILGTLDDKIELNRRMNETLEAIARAIFQSWFVDFDPVRAKASGESVESICQRLGLTPELLALFPDSLVDTELGEIPAGWNSRVFGDWLSRTIGGDWGVDVADDQHGVSVRIIRGTDMPKLKGGVSKNVPSRFVQASKFSSRKLQPEDIVLEVSGGSKDQPTGRGLRVTNEMLRVLGGSVVPASFCRLLRPALPDTGLHLSLHLDAIYSAGKTWEYQNQSTGISNFQTEYFLEHEMVVDPGNSIIAAFNQLVSPLLSGKPSSEAGSLVELRDTLLPKLVSGELDSLGLGSRI